MNDTKINTEPFVPQQLSVGASGVGLVKNCTLAALRGCEEFTACLLISVYDFNDAVLSAIATGS